MKKHIVLAVILALTALQAASPAFAQDDQTPSEATGETAKAGVDEAPASSSQEVEINEDTYRQFMELKDANQQRDIIPETAFKPESGLQKLENLPEESQKHLRNELREIIVDGEPWQPGDENADYPYVPSDAARKDPALQKQELEAWGELVDSYNQREAQIYAGASGNKANREAETGAGEMPGQGSMPEGSTGQDTEGEQGRQGSEAPDSAQADTAGAYSPGTANDPNDPGASGVSQNALEFLQGLEKGDDRPGGGVGTRVESARPAGAAATPGGQAQASAQSGPPAQAAQTGDDSATASQNSTEPSASRDGAAQNALEFLQANAAQPGDTDAAGNGSVQASGGQDGNSGSSSGANGGQDQQTGQDKGRETAQAGTGDTGQTESEAGNETGIPEAAQQGDKAGEQNESALAGGQSGAEGREQSQDGQPAEKAQSRAATPPAEASATSTERTDEESTAGTAQNALEYLTGASPQSAGTADAEAGAETPPEGMLNIQDLLNAQGLGGEPDSPAPAPKSDDKDSSDPTRKDEDGGD